MQKQLEYFSMVDDDEFTIAILGEFQENILIFSGTRNGIIQIYSNQQEQKPIFSFQTNYKVEITSLEFSYKGPTLLVGDIRGNITLFDLYQTKIINSFSRHTLTVTGLTYFREFEDNFISCSLDQTIKIWNNKKKQEIISIKSDDQLLCIDISPDDSWVVCGSQNGTINLYEISTGNLLQKFESENQKKINSIIFNPEEFQMVAGGKEKVLKFFDLQEINFQGNSSMTPSEIKKVKYNNNGTKVYTIGQKFLRIFSAQEQQFKALQNIDVQMTLEDILINQQGLFGIGFNSNRIIFYKKQTKSKSIMQKSNTFQIPTNKKVSENDELNSIQNIMKNHNKIVILNQKKIENIKSIITLWFQQNNIKGLNIAINRINDPQLLVDILNMILENKLLEKMNVQFASLFFQNGLSIIGSNYKSHNKTALQYFTECLKRYTQEIISLKSVPLMSKCDLSREERIQKYDNLLGLVDQLLKKEEFNKIITQYREHSMGKLGMNIINDYNYILESLKGNNQLKLQK